MHMREQRKEKVMLGMLLLNRCPKCNARAQPLVRKKYFFGAVLPSKSHQYES